MKIGTLYDGTRKRLAGSGPKTFTSALDAKLQFKSMLYSKEYSLEKKSILRSNDRLWALPDNFDLEQPGTSKILSDLANVIKAGNRVGLASSDKKTLDIARDSIIYALGHFSGSA